MFSNCTVVLTSVTTTTDDVGDQTTSSVSRVLEWALIAPRSSSERTDPRAPAVVSAASIYGPFGSPLNADDVLIVSGHAASMNGTWQADGIPGDWSLGDWRPGFELAVKRVS